MLVLAVAAAMPGLLRAQARIPTLGVLWIEAARPSRQIAPLVEGLLTQGYMRDRDIRIDDRFLVEGYGGLPEAARQLVATKPEVIITYGGSAIHAAREATTTIPLVMIGGGDPVKLGYVQSLSKPGGNVTGLTVMSSDLSEKRLELLKEAFPKLRRFAVVLYPQSGAEILALRNYEAAARAMGLEMRAIEVRSATDIAPVVGSLSRNELDAIAFVGSTLFRANAAQVVSAVATTRLPSIYVDAFFAESGGLMSYGPNQTEYFRRAGIYVDKILKGAKPAELPIEQPTRLELTINLKAAKAQGIRLPRAFLLRADRVIE